jgi:hypothetical protein
MFWKKKEEVIAEYETTVGAGPYIREDWYRDEPKITELYKSATLRVTEYPSKIRISIFGFDFFNTLEEYTTADNKEQKICELIHKWKKQWEDYYINHNEKDKASYLEYKRRNDIRNKYAEDLKQIVERCNK